MRALIGLCIAISMTASSFAHAEAAKGASWREKRQAITTFHNWLRWNPQAKRTYRAAMAPARRSAALAVGGMTVAGALAALASPPVLLAPAAKAAGVLLGTAAAGGSMGAFLALFSASEHEPAARYKAVTEHAGLLPDKDTVNLWNRSGIFGDEVRTTVTPRTVVAP